MVGKMKKDKFSFCILITLRFLAACLETEEFSVVPVPEISSIISFYGKYLACCYKNADLAGDWLSF